MCDLPGAAGRCRQGLKTGATCGRTSSSRWRRLAKTTTLRNHAGITSHWLRGPCGAGTRAQCHILFGMPDTIHGMWGRIVSCAPVVNRRGRPVYKRFGRVTNPPQVANLPHSSCRMPGSGKSMRHWALVPAASRLIGARQTESLRHVGGWEVILEWSLTIDSQV